MANKKSRLQNRTLSRVESLLGVFMALLIPSLMGAGPEITEVAATLLR